MTASNTVFTVFSGIGLVLSVIPLWWHRTVGTCAYLIWTLLACLVFFVNSVLWSGNTVNWAPVWCDICVRVQIAAPVAWSACVLCIIHRLYKIVTSTVVSISPAEKRRENIVDLLISVGVPVLGTTLEYIVAGRRFTIIEDIGCWPATVNTPLAYLLVYSWPLAIGVTSAGYGVLALRAFLRKRKRFEELISSNSTVVRDSYRRLMVMCTVDFCFTIPLATWAIVENAKEGVRPWVSWASIHEDYSRIPQIPRTLLDAQCGNDCGGLEVSRWGAVLCAFVFFAYFGFAEEAKKNYRSLATTIAKLLGNVAPIEKMAISDPRADNQFLRFASPASTSQQTESKRDSGSLPGGPLNVNNECDPEAGEEPAFTCSSETILSPHHEVPRTSVAALDPASVEMLSASLRGCS